MISCAKCGLKVDDINGPSAELSIRVFKNSETTDKVYEFIKICVLCVGEIMRELKY